MRISPAIVLALWALWPAIGASAPVGYSINITTAYADGDPFANQIDNAVWSEPDTGYIQVMNTGATTFSGVVATTAVSAFAGDLSFASNPLVLAPGAEISIAMWYNSASVGGFNAPYYTVQPGVEIDLDGSVSDAAGSETVNLMVADSNIHSGITNTDPYGLTSDSYVLQGGDPWGLDNSASSYALNQADGVYVFSEAVPEPSSAACLAAGLVPLFAARRRFRFRPA